MKTTRSATLILITLVVLILVPTFSVARECSDFSGMTAALQSRQEWTRWCTDCGGTVSSGPICEPGQNWIGKKQTIVQQAAPGNDRELERLRQQKIERDCPKMINYNKGLVAMRSNDPVAAIKYFAKALKAQPGDQKCRNAMLLAESMRKVQHKKVMNKIIAEMEMSY